MNNNENQEKLLYLVKLIKQARQESLLGLYDSALIHYNQAMLIIKSKIYDEYNNKDTIEKWKITEYNIKNEIIQIKQMYEICKEINNTEFDYSKKQVENIENKKTIEKEVLGMLIQQNRIEKTRNNFLPSSTDKIKKPKIYIAKINLINDNKSNDTKINQWLNYKQRKNNNKIIKDNVRTLQKSDNIFYLKRNKSSIFVKQKIMINPIEEFNYRTKNKNISELTDGSLKENIEMNAHQNYMNIKNDNSYIHKKLLTQNFFQKIGNYKQSQMNNMDNKKLTKKKSYNTKIKRKMEIIKIDLDEEMNKIDKNNKKK